MKRILSALFALVCAASASAAPFQNGSFELGTHPAPGDVCNVPLVMGSNEITGWTVVLGNIDWPDNTCWPATRGSRSLDLVGTGSIGGIEQTFDTVAGQTYLVSFDLAGNPGAFFVPPAVKNLMVTLSSGGVPFSSLPFTFDTTGKVADSFPNHMGWTTKFFTFVANAPSTTIRFVSDMTGSSHAGATLDNVSIAPLGGPTDQWTGSSGLVYSGQRTGGPPVICSGAGANWNQVGGGPFGPYPLTVTSDGSNGPVVASYNVPQGNTTAGICGSWTTSATAASSGDVVVQWDYRGDHASNNVTADLEAFVIRAASADTSSYVLVNPAAGGSFLHSGQYTFQVQPGDVYGFTMTGSNFDSTDAMFGTLFLTHNFIPAVTTPTSWTGAQVASTIPSSPLVVSDGTAGPAVFTYDTAVDTPSSQTGDWTFQTTAAVTGPVTLNWTYSGYHGTCQAVASLAVYVIDGPDAGTDTFSSTPYFASDAGCAFALPSGGFGEAGQVVLNVGAGDTYGFQMHASNFDFNGRLRGRLTVTTGSLPTTTTLAPSSNPALTGSTVTFTATVAGSNPTGTVTFTREGRIFGSSVAECQAVPLVAGSATCTTSFLFLGDNHIKALYSGDTANAGSTSATLTQQMVNAAVATAPVLIRALPTGSAVVPLLIGRVDGLPNTPITVRLFGGTTCTNGVLGGTVTPIGTDASLTTEPAVPSTGYLGGYFGTPQGGTQGQFVAIQVTSVQGVSPLSNCLVTAADNDTWPKALTLTGNSVSVPDWIDTAGKARWYKFSVFPGQSIQVTLSGLPADYDLAVFKNIAAEFANELVPANTAELTRLSAQYAPSAFSPSAFSPSAFSPSAFSPSAFSPSAFSPSAFSPSAFSPSAFSPSAFSPSAFSPSAFSPSAFSPSAFSPSAFSPSAFSPSAFSPSAFSPTELAQAFSAAQTRSIIAASMTPGTGNESVIVNTWNNTGDFYVRVTGRAGAFSTSSYNVAVTKQGTSCAAVTDTTISSNRTATGSFRTVILLDSSKTPLSATVPGVPGQITLGGKLDAFKALAEVNGVIVDVATDPRVTALKAQAQTNVGCPYAKNLVANEIKSIVDAYSMTNVLKYIVILGNDDAIPFFRYPDQTLLGQESGFVPPVSSNSASEASLRGNFVLSQDAYGATNSISLRATEFPIPGLAVGRLIETPTEIAGMIDAYVAANGFVTPTSSLVTGYDFLEDAAEAVRVELAAGTGSAPDTLITPSNVSPQDPRTYVNGGPWTATDLRDKLLTARHDVMFLAGHFNANSALAADFKTSMITSDLAAADLTNALVFSAGCHAGYNLVDTDAINGVTFPLDWAQAFAQKQATLIAGTGYQYGDTEFLEYSERLYLNFAKELRAGTGNVAIGEALVKAKRAYLAATQDVRGLHEKAVLEATLFGLPMLAVNMPAGRTPVTSNAGVIDTNLIPVVGDAAILGLRLADLSVSPTLTPHTLTLTNYDPPSPTTTIATWLSGPDGVVTNPAEPALPLKIVNVTPIVSTLVLRGVGFRGATYSDSTVFPLTGAPTTELRGVHTPFSSPLFFPMRLWTSNYFSALSGNGGTSLLVTPAQHRSVDGSNNSTLRQYSGLDLRLFYSDLKTTNLTNSAFAAAVLSDAPTIVRVDAATNAGVTTFSAQVVGDPSAVVHEVWVTYTDGAGGLTGSWTSINLQQCRAPSPPAVCGTTADSQYWKGEIASGSLPTDTKYIVQAVNGTGLVSLDDNLGRYYSIAGTPPAASALSVGSPVPASVAYGNSVSVTATLSASGLPLDNKVVTIAAGGVTRSGNTNAAGSVTVQLPMFATPGTHPISASFGGDSMLLPSAASAPSAVTVTKAVTTLAPPATGVGAVLTAGSQPLIHESVHFLISGPLGMQQVFAITDYNGRATIPPPGLPLGTYSVVQACFAGNTTYTSAKLIASQACVTTGGVNNAPVAANDAYSSNEDTPLTVAAPGVLGNDTDLDASDTKIAILATGPTAAQGTLTLNANGSFTFTPAANFNGTASFTYQAKDAALALSNAATVTITVNAVNDAPVAASQSVTTNAAPVTVTLSASDIDSASVTFSIVTGPSRGSLGPVGSPSCAPAGGGSTCTATVTYTPTSAYSGADSFTFKASAGSVAGNVATITVINTAIQRVSVSSSGTQGNSFSGNDRTALSADGRFVAFVSLSSNLVPGDTSSNAEIFVYDRQVSQMQRVTVGPTGVAGNGQSLFPSISGDGRYVSYASNSNNLVTGDSNGKMDIFVYDRTTPTPATQRVSVGAGGAQGNGDSLSASMSSDGRYVAFSSTATNLVSGDTNGKSDIFVRDRTAGLTTRVSVATSGQSNGDSSLPSISDDGRYVTFNSTATNLVAGDTNGKSDVFIYDRNTGLTKRVSVTSTGGQANGDSHFSALSSDGNYVTYSSTATNLVSSDTNGKSDVFLWVRATGATTRVSVVTGGAQSNGDSIIPALSGDGRYVAYSSTATNLVAGDTNGKSDIYVYDRNTLTTKKVTIGTGGAQSNGDSLFPALSADGTVVGFTSFGSNLVPGDTNSVSDVFVKTNP